MFASYVLMFARTYNLFSIPTHSYAITHKPWYCFSKIRLLLFLHFWSILVHFVLYTGTYASSIPRIRLRNFRNMLSCLQCLDEVIINYIQGRAIFNFHLTDLDSIGYKEIPDIDLTSPFLLDVHTFFVKCTVLWLSW